MTTIAELAKEMGVTEADVSGFVECLRYWMNKGLTFEQAIEKHMRAMVRMVNNTTSKRIDEMRPWVAEVFFPSE